MGTPTEKWEWADTSMGIVTHLGPPRKRQRMGKVVEPKDALHRLNHHRKMRDSYVLPWRRDETTGIDEVYHVSPLGDKGLVQVSRDSLVFSNPGIFQYGNGEGLRYYTRDVYDASELYWKKVHEAHFTPEGQKAKDLLYEFILPRCREELDKTGRTKVKWWYPSDPDDVFSEPVKVPVARVTGMVEFLIQLVPLKLGFVIETSSGERRVLSSCWHPEEVLPPGDIALAHLLQAQESFNDYLTQSNW